MKLTENIEDQLHAMLKSLPFGKDRHFGDYTYDKYYTVIEEMGEVESHKRIALMVEVNRGDDLILTKIGHDISLNGKLDFHDVCDFLNALASSVVV